MGEAVIHGPGEGERHSAGGTSAIIIKATADDTAGSFFLSETTIEPGFPGPPFHRHERLHDMFYVLPTPGGTHTNVPGPTVSIRLPSPLSVPPLVRHRPAAAWPRASGWPGYGCRLRAPSFGGRCAEVVAPGRAELDADPGAEAPGGLGDRV
jgi:hypothetical protein